MKNNQLSSTKDIFTIPSLWKAIRNLISKLGGGAPIVGNVVIESDPSKALYYNDFSDGTFGDLVDDHWGVDWVMDTETFDFNVIKATHDGNQVGEEIYSDSYIYLPIPEGTPEDAFIEIVVRREITAGDFSDYTTDYDWKYYFESSSVTGPIDEWFTISFPVKDFSIVGFEAYSVPTDVPQESVAYVKSFTILSNANISANSIYAGTLSAFNIATKGSLFAKEADMSHGTFYGRSETTSYNSFLYFALQNNKFFNFDIEDNVSWKQCLYGTGSVKGTSGISKANSFGIFLMDTGNSRVQSLWSNKSDGVSFPAFMMSATDAFMYNGGASVYLSSLNANEAASQINSRLQIGFTQGNPNQSNMSDLYVNKDIEIQQIGSGVIMKSPNGTKYKVTVDNTGNLVTAAV